MMGKSQMSCVTFFTQSWVVTFSTRENNHTGCLLWFQPRFICAVLFYVPLAMTVLHQNQNGPQNTGVSKKITQMFLSRVSEPVRNATTF